MASGRLPWRLTTIVVVILTTSALSTAVDPPRIKGPLYESWSRPSGTPVTKIDCRVEVIDQATKNSLIVSWYWNEELIHSQWDRFTISENNGKWILRIRDLHVEDSGNFSCEATNGFGRAKYTVNLLVTDLSNKSQAQSSTTSAPAPAPTLARTTGATPNAPDVINPVGNNAPRNTNAKAPKFEGQRSTQSSTEVVERFVGGSVELHCKARGSPLPGIIWKRDNQQIQITGTRVGTVRIGRWILELKDLRLSDSGRYSCRAYNEYGAVEFTYILKVQGDEALTPKVTTAQANVTLHVGDNALLPCSVKSEQVPHVQWLKRLGGTPARPGTDGGNRPMDTAMLSPAETQPDSEQEQQTPDDEEERYVVLSAIAPQASNGPDDLFHSYLRIDKVSERDAGTYVCWAKNNHGYSHAELRVRVISQNGQMFDAPPADNGVPPASAGRIILGGTSDFNTLDADKDRFGAAGKPLDTQSDSNTSLDGRNLLSVYIVVPVLVVVVSLLVAIYYWKNRRRIRAKQTRLRLHYSAAANNSNHGLLLECTTSSSSAAATFYTVAGPLSGSGSRLLHSGHQNDYQLSCHAVPSLINAVPVSGSGFNIADTHFALQNNISPSSASQLQDECAGDSAEYTQSSRYTQSSSCTATNNNNNVNCAMRPCLMFSPTDAEYHNFGTSHAHARATMQKSNRLSDRRYPRIIIAAPPPTASSCTSSPLSFVSKV